MKTQEVLEILARTGVLMEGHFLLTSGKHSDRFLLCSQVLQYPPEAEKICQALARLFPDQGIDTVMGPAMGGIILSYETARALDCRAIYTEKEGRDMVLKRGFSLSPGERVLVVEDVMTTGGSAKKVVNIAREKGAQVVGVAAMVDRSGGSIDLGVPIRSLVQLSISSWDPDQCPLCLQGVELIRPKS